MQGERGMFVSYKVSKEKRMYTTTATLKEQDFWREIFKMEEDHQEVEKLRFNRYITKAKQCMSSEQYHNALKYFKKAEMLFSSDKLVKKILKITKFLEEYDEDSDEEDDESFETVNGFKIHKGCWDKLFPYQKEGVLWFWDLFKKNTGGILGDDMGLGKTIQIIAFLSGMFDQGLVETALIVVPKSLMENWINEFQKWAPGILLEEFHGTVAKRNKNLKKVQRRNGVILTTYGLVFSSHEQLSNYDGERFVWDFIILDEGHKIKNQNKTSKSVRSIPAKNHFILTGTPIQNNLSELWSLVDFVTQGKLLGTLKTFKGAFEYPIVRGREKDASIYEMQKGNEISRTLRKMIEQYFLRRTKAEVNKDESSTFDGTQSSEINLNVKLAEKSDLIVWLYLSDKQLQIYQDFLSTAIVREAMVSTKSPLLQLTMLKKIADHPRLLSSTVCDALGLSDEMYTSEEVLVQESSKIQFLLKLVRNLKEENHRVLIFSQSRKMLDIVDKVLTKEGTKLLRFDGRILDPADRQSVIDKFQADSSITCLLLTTQIGSVGLNLTSADRVVIFDPSWNPGTDAQAVDRAYRIGQNKDVVIYRLVTCGTIEEKIYRKQIFKDSISKQTTGSSKNPLRYFERKQLRDLFILENPRVSETHGILEELNSEKEHKPGPELSRHLDFLKSLNIFGISYHGLVFSKEAAADGDSLYENQIMEEAKRAEGLLIAESNLCDQMYNMSLNNNSIFKPSREDVKRYMPSHAKVRKGEDTKTSERIVIPDSPTPSDRGQPMNAPSCINSASGSLGETSCHFELENEAIDTVQDSLNSTPCDTESGLENIQDIDCNIANEFAKVDDSYKDKSIRADAPHDGECLSTAESSNNDDVVTHTRNDSKDQNSFQLDRDPTQNCEEHPHGEHVVDWYEGEDSDSYFESGDVDKNPVHSEYTSPDFVPKEFDDNSATNEGSYIKMTEPFGDIDPGIITSPVVDIRPRALLFSRTGESRFDIESRTDRESVPKYEENQRATSRVQYRENMDDRLLSEVARTKSREQYRESISDSLLSEEASTTAETEGSFCSDKARALVGENQSPSAVASISFGGNSQQHSPNCEDYQTSSTSRSTVGRSPQTSFADDQSDNVEEAVCEVIDAACSPMKDIMSSSGTPVAGQYHEPTNRSSHFEELRSFRELEKSLRTGLILREDMQHGSATRRSIRRSAIGLMYGLCDDFVEGEESENSICIDVVDAACSPISTKEIDSEVVEEARERYSNGLLDQHTVEGLVSGHSVKVNNLEMHPTRRPNFLQSNFVDCSTPQDEQPVSVTKHMAVCEAQPSFQETLKPDNDFGSGGILGHTGESIHRSGGLVSISGGSEQYQGSESLFSTLSEEARLGDQKAWSKLTISSGASSNTSESGPRISHQMSPAPRPNSRVSSKLEHDSKCEYIREEPEDVSKFVRSFNLEIQEDTTLILDQKIPIKSHYISESDSDLQSNKSYQALINDDHVEVDVHQSNHCPEIVESCNENSIYEDDEIVLKELNSLDHELVSDHESVSDHLENIDCLSDADSISSNEMNMISVLSGNRQSPLYQNQSASSMIDSYPDASDSSDSESELLQRSRRSLRRSIMSLQRKSGTIESTFQNPTTASADGSPEVRENFETIDALGGHNPASGNSAEWTCEEHVTAEVAVKKCISMLTGDMQCSAEQLNVLLPLLDTLKNAEYDLEIRREVCELGI